MEANTSAKFIKILLILQILVVIGIAICEIIQLAEVDNSRQAIENHQSDWNYLVGYTDSIIIILARIYYWIVAIISLGILGWTLSSFERRWKDIQEYSDKSRNMWMLVLWCIATIPNIIIISESNGLKSCSASSYNYSVAPRLLIHCDANLASLFLAYILILLIIIQLLFHSVIVKHQKKIIKPPPIMQEPKLTRVRRSKRVTKKRHSLKSTFSNGTRLSIVTEDDEEKSDKSIRSGRSGGSTKNNKIGASKNVRNNNERRVYSNV